MEMSGKQLINAPQETVWVALNDPEVLKACIPGCQELVVTEEGGFEATVQAKVGPVKAKFSGVVTLSDIDAPNGYTITGEGKGGAAGFAKGGAKVALATQDNGTMLSYEVDAKVGGKLAQIGSRLIDSTAKKMAADFFEKFSEQLVDNSVVEEKPDETPPPVEETPTTTSPSPQDIEDLDTKMVPILGMHPFVWTVGLVGLVVGLIFGFSG